MNPIRKGLVFGVIFLFIGLAFAPTINANIGKEELVEFTTEVCGMNGAKRTIELTQQEANEVEGLFKSHRNKLNATSSREETELIYKETVAELDKYGLIGGLSVKQAQRLVTGDYRNPFTNTILRKIVGEDKEYLNNKSFLISGLTSRTVFYGPLLMSMIRFGDKLAEIYKDYEENDLFLFVCYSYVLLMYFFMLPLNIIGNLINPLKIGSLIAFGYRHVIHTPTLFSSKGWLHDGTKKWEGPFIGNLFSLGHIDTINYVGVTGFTGFKLFSGERFFFIGSALSLKLKNT